MRRLFPRTITGQLIAVALIAMIVSQLALMAVMVAERQGAEQSWWTNFVLARAASIVRLLDASPDDLHEQIVRASSLRQVKFSTSPDNTAAAWPAGEVSERYSSELGEMVGREADSVIVAVGETPSLFTVMQEWLGSWQSRAPVQGTQLRASVRLKNGKWLNMDVVQKLHLPRAMVVVVPILTMLAVFGTAVIIIIGRITRPMKKLALAAQALGRGEEVPPVPVSGPTETRHAIEAFNDMRERLSRFVLDRTRMLAAVGHDLRTPITNLRLRAEFIEDEETRTRILASLDEMQHLAETALAFARQEAATEPTRMVDLNALVQSVCADQADMDRDVVYADNGRLPIRCRPNSLKRALHNLIENAILYGKRARVFMNGQGEELSIVVEDDGPGIPAEDMARVFAPFVRLDGSRGHATGGIGLGLAIARSIVRGHGGDIVLKNRPGGGLNATILLPRQE